MLKRFQSPRLIQEARWQVLNFPHKVLEEPDALEILLGVQLPNDVSFQLKVWYMFNIFQAQLIGVVSVILGCCESCDSSHLLYACLRKPSVYHPICNESN